MNLSVETIWRIAGISAFLSVAAGAYASHGINKITQDLKKIESFKTGANYHLMHSIGLFLTPFSTRSNLVASLFLGGIVCFSGSLYMMATTNKKAGRVPPLGGLMFLAGWLTLGFTLNSKLIN